MMSMESPAQQPDVDLLFQSLVSADVNRSNSFICPFKIRKIKSIVVNGIRTIISFHHTIWNMYGYKDPCKFLLQVHICELLEDKKFRHFRPVMDTYIKNYFCATLVHRCCAQLIWSKIWVIKEWSSFYIVTCKLCFQSGGAVYLEICSFYIRFLCLFILCQLSVFRDLLVCLHNRLISIPHTHDQSKLRSTFRVRA